MQTCTPALGQKGGVTAEPGLKDLVDEGGKEGRGGGDGVRGEGAMIKKKPNGAKK